MTPQREREEKADGCGFPSMKTICNFGFAKKLNPCQDGNTVVGGHKHCPCLRERERQQTQLCLSCDIFVEFWVSILPSSKIFCWMEGCTQPLPASINCVYSFNEFMCLWCGLKVKLIPDGRAHYYSGRRDPQNIVNNLLSKLLWVKTSWRARWWHYSGDATSGAICAVT